MQYTCVMSNAQQRGKYFELSVITFCGLMTCFLFTIMTRWLHHKGKINQVEWNMATITAGDYTVEMKIKAKSFKKWHKQEYMKEGGDHAQEIPSSLSLKKHMIRIIEEQLTKDLDIQQSERGTTDMDD